jgi:hypothetical protein
VVPTPSSAANYGGCSEADEGVGITLRRLGARPFMFRSLLNSAKGKSALQSALQSDAPAVRLHARQSPASTPVRLPPISTGTDTVIHPDRCCVYCGHAVYAPPRVPRVRCPHCTQELPVKDITLSGEVREQRILTGGKIIVASDARIEAELVACHVDIAGKVMGNILASHCCRLRPTAKLAGDILCRHLQIDPGALLEGQVELIKAQN